MQDHFLAEQCVKATAKFIEPQQVMIIEQSVDIDFIGTSIYLETVSANTLWFIRSWQSNVVEIQKDVVDFLVAVANDDRHSLSKIKEKHPLVFIGFRPGIFFDQPSGFIIAKKLFAQIPTLACISSMSLVSTTRMFVSFCGSSILQALRMLNAMNEQLGVAWSVLITACVHHSSYGKAFHMFKKKNSLRIQSNELRCVGVTCHGALLTCRFPRSVQFNFIHWDFIVCFTQPKQTKQGWNVKGRQPGWLVMILAVRQIVWFAVQAICEALGQLVWQVATAIHISLKLYATSTIARSLQQKKIQSQAYRHRIRKGLGTYCSVAFNAFNLEDKVVVKEYAMIRARLPVARMIK
ncbi:hypothetical protein COLO4_34033 [Corchorus olitorius]|uniref:Uncharacterized protein n=1 Tax=Corchorus olitorius TaxID=93759 RepID=A0A1R3GP51_9ROSI|nr:hypothetical protein COLO4_34033 [Corchorus olitorius]